MKLTLLGNRVLCEPLPQSTISAGGIYLAGKYQDDEKRYRVVATGPGKRLKNGEYARVECKPGDVVLVSPYLSHHVLEDGKRIFDASQVELVEMSQYA